MNDQYCNQTSKKIRQIFDYKRSNGQYIGSFAPYGYIKDQKDKHQLIVDADVAEIVKRVYFMFLQGSSKRTIVLYLINPIYSGDGSMCPCTMVHELVGELRKKQYYSGGNDEYR